MTLPTHCAPLDSEAGICPECAKALLARVTGLEAGNSRIREAADHPLLNLVEKLATIKTILVTMN